MSAAPAARLTDLLEQRAARSPDHPALVGDDRTIANAELVREVRTRAGQLARFGDAPGTPIAVVVRRDLESVLALMAVLEAGCAYVPVDAGWPEDRREFVVRDAGARAVVTPGEGPGLEVERRDGPPADLPPDTAYVLYTSGSSGRPKGVVVTHANVLSMLSATSGLVDRGPDDVWSVFHSLCFDFSVWEIWGAMSTGGSAVLAGAREVGRPNAFVEFLSRHRVSVLSLVPSIFRRVIDACEALAWPELAVDLVVLGGEAVDRGQCLRWLERPGARGELVNMYGITEATVHATFIRLQAQDLVPLTATRTPIGRALPTLEVVVLDADDRAAAPGEIGEVVIAGAGVAHGYVNDAAQNAARFVTLDLGRGPQRFLRTGDLALRDAAGELFYSGRADSQVKVNGYRIELAEVEAGLADHPSVLHCAATTLDDPQGSTRLALVVETLEPVDPSDLRRHLLRRLPPYLAPGLVYVVDRLPLSDNGKIDRSACRRHVQAELEGRVPVRADA